MENLAYNAANDKSTEMQTLTAVLHKAVNEGYVTNFTVTKQGICTHEAGVCYLPEDIKVVNFFRFEGDSDPGDNTILFIIETTDGLKGTLVDAYGPYADPIINAFMKRVEDMHKKQTIH